jgi:trigger factor
MMQVTVDDLSSVKKTLHIEIPEEDVTRELDKAYENLKKTAKIKGFRKGKVPRSVLESRFKKDVSADVSSKLIQDSFISAIKEKDLKIVGNPNIDPPDLQVKGPYKYSATVEVHPEIDTIDFKGLSLKKTLYTVSDEEIETQLKMIQKNLAQQRPIEEDRAAAADDFAIIDYEGFTDGTPSPELQKTENFTLKIGGALISKDFDEGLIGMKKGEQKELTVSFPGDHANPKLAGQTVRFEVTLKDLREEFFLPIDDELAKKVGKYETLDALKAEIAKNLKQGYDKRTEHELNEQVFQALLAKVDFEVPETMIDYELQGIISDAERSFTYHNMSLEEVGMTRESLSEKYRDTAEKQVKRHLILSQIIEQESLELPEEDLEAAFGEMAESIGQPVDEIRTFYENNPDRLEYFKHSLLEKNAAKLIIGAGSVEEVEPSKETDADADA